MAQIGLNITITGLTGKLIIRWVRASAPLAEVGRSAAFDFPYDDVYTIPDLQPVVYIVQLWRSDDGIALDQLIKDWSIDASKQTTTSITMYQYLTGRGDTEGSPSDGTYWADPSDGDINLVDERLDGFTQDQLIVQESGYGNHLNAEYSLLAGGGITLLDGKTFDEGVAWFITVISTETTTIPSDAGGSSLYGGIEIITADTDFYTDATDNLYNKLCPVNAAGTTVTVTFQDLSLIPDDTHVTFQTQQGMQNYLVLQFDVGDTVNFLGKQVNVIYLALCEKISLYFSGGVCYVIDYDGMALQRGCVSLDYDSDRNTDTGALLYADESTGELDKADYPGLYEFILQLSGTSVCPLGTASGEWSYNDAGSYPNKVKFGIDTTAETFRVPSLLGFVAKGSATPGVYEADNVGSFSGNISMPKGYGYTGAPNVARMGNGYSNPVYFDIPFTYTGAITETRVKSYSQKPFIIL